MKEKIITGKKHGMAMMLLTILIIIASFAVLIYGAILSTDESPSPLLLVGILLLCITWIPFMGLKVLKPQEALVLTLFGKYIGTLKGDGFFWVNPFCTAFNPAAKTKLNQSGDVSNPTIVASPNQG